MCVARNVVEAFVWLSLVVAVGLGGRDGVIADLFEFVINETVLYAFLTYKGSAQSLTRAKAKAEVVLVTWRGLGVMVNKSDKVIRWLAITVLYLLRSGVNDY
jgi:hypothetical protein